MQLITLPTIPNTAMEKKVFMMKLFSQLAKIDRSSSDVLQAWIAKCDRELGELDSICRKFQQNNQGLDRLDRFLGSLFAEKAAENPTFGVNFSTYVEGCRERLVSPKGRVFLVMICHQFRVDRMRGRAVRIHHLYSIPLKGFKMHEV